MSEIKTKFLSSKLNKEQSIQKTILLIYLSFIVTLHILVSFDVLPYHRMQTEEVECLYFKGCAYSD